MNNKSNSLNVKVKKMKKINTYINIVSIIGFVMAILLKQYYIAVPFPFIFIIKHFILWNFFKKYFNFTTYYIHKNKLYKIGIFKNGPQKPSDEKFRTDNFSSVEELKKWYGQCY